MMWRCRAKGAELPVALGMAIQDCSKNSPVGGFLRL